MKSSTNTEQLSDCCGKLITSDHECDSHIIKIGGRCECGVVITRYICSHCNRPCNIATPDTKKIEHWEREFDFDFEWHITSGLKESQQKEAIKDFIRHLIRTEREKTEKAYGGCHKCYGKGYATYRHGLRYSADMLGDKEYVDPMETHMVYCSCDRGKQLKELVSADREKILEAVKLVTFPEQDEGEPFERWVDGYNAACDDLNAIREKVINDLRKEE